MGVNQSKEELLYQQVNYGNMEGIKALHREGARLEWIDKEGKTPLILACMRPDLLHVAKALIEMGANVNAYRPGSHAGTPLHHAAKRGLDSTVILLLSHGANPLVMNDDCQIPLELARAKGHTNVVRAIENRICLFAGWLREIHGPSILEAFIPQLVSKKIWAVVLPCDSRNPTNPRKFQLAIYPDLQVSQPRTVVYLWKAQIEEPKFNQPDPALIIVETAKKTRSKFLSAREGDKQQMQWFYNACRGIYQISHIQPSNVVPAPPPAAPPLSNPPLSNHLQAASAPYPEDVQLAMAIDASIQTALVEGVSLPRRHQATPANPTHTNQPSTHVGSSGWPDQPTHNETAHPKVRPNASTPQLHTSQTEQEAHHPATAPSAPPISDETIYGGPIHYPSIDSSPVDLAVPPIGSSESKEDGNSASSSSSSTCVICLDKPVEGACIPCGHMAGCMSCLKEIKEKRGECPVCRAKIDQIVRLYAV